ncbi:MAG TPA: AGE family epimerase/isomerase, partial [Vicinamibacteria bacterium]
MERRSFLGSTAAASAGLLARESATAGAVVLPTPPATLAGLALPALRRKYQDELFGGLIPFWDAHGIDHERGGFMCALDDDGTPVNTHKFLWFQGRGIWVYSRLYGSFGRDPRHLEIARKAVRFCLDHVRQPDGSWAQLVSRDGDVLQPPRPDTTGVLYMAEGLQEYAAASGDDEARAMAAALLKSAFREGAEDGSATRRQGLWFLSLLVATQMLERWRDPEIAEIAARCVDAIVSRHHNPETRLNDEVVRADLSRSDEAGFTVFGHSLEALWMVMDEVRRRSDESTWTTCAERVRRHLEVGWDRVHGGLSHAVRVDQGGYVWPPERPVGTEREFRSVGEYHYMKTFWSLCETLIATIKVLEHAPAPWASEGFSLAQETIDQRFSLRPRGHPLYALFTDRRITPPLRS